MSTLGRLLLRLGKLEESKHIQTYRGPTTFKDQIAQMHSAMLPNVAQMQRLAHQSAKTRLNTQVKNFGNLTLSRFRQIARGEFSAELALRDVKEEFRQLYHEAFALGMSGSTAGLHSTSELISLEDRRWVDSSFNHEMRFFNRFIGQVVNRELSPGQIDNRVQMYLNAVRGVYEAGRVVGTHPNSLIYWVYNPEAHHCMSCLYLRDHSPFTKKTIPKTPQAGATECLSNCKCHLRIQISDPEIVKQVESRSTSKAAHISCLNQLKRRRTSKFGSQR